jgi:hypothetical protein
MKLDVTPERRCTRSFRARFVARAVLAALLAASPIVPAGPAQAAPRPREQLEADARRACAAGRVDEGIEILADLFASHGHPNYIYNQGRCFQENGKPEQAISRFREYLRVATDAPAAARDQAERFIRELEGERRGPRPRPMTEPVPAPRPMPPPPPPVSAAPAVTERLPPPPAPARSSPGLTTAAIVFGAVGLVGATGGLIAGARVRSLEKEVEEAPLGRFDVEQLSDHAQKAHRFETLQWVGYGVAGAGLVGAVICLLVNRAGRSDRAAARFTVAGLAGGRPGLTLAGQF